MSQVLELKHCLFMFNVMFGIMVFVGFSSKGGGNIWGLVKQQSNTRIFKFFFFTNDIFFLIYYFKKNRPEKNYSF